MLMLLLRRLRHCSELAGLRRWAELEPEGWSQLAAVRIGLASVQGLEPAMDIGGHLEEAFPGELPQMAGEMAQSRQ